MWSFGLNLEKQIKDLEQKIGRLANKFLDGIIDQSTYLTKKGELVHEKTKLTEQQEDLGQKGTLWNEPQIVR